MIKSQAFRSVMVMLVGVATISAVGGASNSHAADLPSVIPIKTCESLAGTVTTAGTDPVRITSAQMITAAAPAPYCEILGYVAPQVKFQLKLPMQNWHQRFLYAGCGGFCGAIRARVGAADGCEPVTNGEFALVASNMGHDSSPDSDAVWASNNLQGRLDWGRRAVHVVTLAAKQIIGDFYGQAPKYSYFTGCSDGGREGMMEAQAYPTDFDGIVVGAPVMNVTANNTIYHAWNGQHLVNLDGSLRLSSEKISYVHASVVSACDGVSGDKDGLVDDPATCVFTPQQIACGISTDQNCLTASEVKLVADLYRGPTDAKGKALYFGVPKGSELSWPGQGKGGLSFAGNFMTFLTKNPTGKPIDAAKATFTSADIARYGAFDSVLNATSTDLTSYVARGGKLIIWHGWSDAAVPAGSSVSYHRAIKARFGNLSTQSFMRLYMLPGVTHCGGGEGPDRVNMLGAMLAWVEDGKGPTSMTVRDANTSALSYVQPYEQ